MQNKTILISPWAKALRNGKENAKNYAYWKELVGLLKNSGFHVIQVGVTGERDIGAHEKRLNLNLTQLKELIDSCAAVITVDSFIQHYCWYIGKQAVVLWGVSDPLIFGHPENINLLKSRESLRPDPFRWWEDVEYSNYVWFSPEYVYEEIVKLQ
jgi:ADP-heptose:LPS heptosyltransferase